MPLICTKTSFLQYFWHLGVVALYFFLYFLQWGRSMTFIVNVSANQTWEGKTKNKSYFWNDKKFHHLHPGLSMLVYSNIHNYSYLKKECNISCKCHNNRLKPRKFTQKVAHFCWRKKIFLLNSLIPELNVYLCGCCNIKCDHN